MGLKEVQEAWGLEHNAFANLLVKAESYVGAVSSIISIYTTVTKVIGWFSAEGEDELAEIKEELNELRKLMVDNFEDLKQLIQDADKHNTWSFIASDLGMARGATATLQALIPEHAEAISDCLGDVNNALENLKVVDSRWVRVNAIKVVFSDPWVGDVKTDQTADYVYDHVRVLHVFVEVLAHWLSISALDETAARSAGTRSQAAVHAMFLDDQYNTIRNAIKPVRAPTRSEVEAYFPFGRAYYEGWGWQPQVSPWDSLGRTYGAIECFCGVNNTERFPDDAFPFPNPPVPPEPKLYPKWGGVDVAGALSSPAYKAAHATYQSELDHIYPRFLALHRVATKSKQKSLYRALGLDAVRRMVDHLRRVAGEEPLGRDSYPLWSLRAVADIVHELTPEFGNGKVEVRALAQWIRGNKFTMSRFTALETLNPRNPMDEVVLVGVDV